MLTSYHNHTPLCNHATGSPREYVLRAIEAGYTHFGFADHAPHCFVDASSKDRMSLWEFDGYVKEISNLKREFSSYITIRTGIELEYFPTTHKRDMENYRRAGIEYIILGQHLIGSGTPEDHISSFKRTDSRDSYTKYVDRCIEALGSGDFNYFAHPDVFNYRIDEDFYCEESERLIRAAINHSIPLELNMYGLSDGRHYPYEPFWKIAARLGAVAVLGRDAHSTERVFSEEENILALRFADRMGIELKEIIL